MRLSTRLTFCHKIGFPIWVGLVVFAGVGGFAAMLKTGFAWVALLPGLGAVAFTIVWARSLKAVELHGDVFRIRGCFAALEAPAAHLESIEEHAWSRMPGLTLHFSPPTAFGPVVRMLTPMEWLARREFESVAATLRGLVARNRGPGPQLPPSEATAAVEAILAEPTLSQRARLPALADRELDLLIDRLPWDSELRDAARRLRMRRWYG